MMFQIKRIELDELAKSLYSFSDVIKRNIINGDYNEAIKIQEYCLLITYEIKGYLESNCKINIDKTFLKKHFKILIKKLESSINLDKIKLLNENKLWSELDIIENKLREIVCNKLLQVSENPYDEFFNVNTQAEIEKKILSEIKKHPNLSFADFESFDKKLANTTFGELSEKLISKKTWVCFEPIFKNKAELNKRIAQLLPFRNKYAHNNKANSVNLHDAKAAVDWFYEVLGI